jgi:hypothetical protein
MVTNEVDMIGQKFGRLLVISRAPSRHKRAYWNCVCDCGKTCVANGKYMRQGKKHSCGCLRSELSRLRMPALIAGNVLPLGEAAFNLLYATYRCSAEKRGFEFALTKEDFESLTQRDCFYCGMKPSQLARPQMGGGYLYNGIDRNDNSQGYTLTNSVPCCKLCNWMKNQFDVVDFLNHCKMIVEFQSSKGL